MEANQEKSGIIILDLDNNSSETSGNGSGATMVAPGAILHSYSDYSVGDSSSSSPSLSASSSSYFNKKKVDAPFVRKTYDMVNNPKTNSIVSWNSDGSRIVIWDAHKFAAEILPTYFRHNNFSSFVCQLNTYGFKKADWDKWEFQHQWFQRGKESWLKKIKRRTTRSSRLAPIPLQEQQQHQLPHDEETSAVKVEKEIKEMLDEQNAMEMEIKQLQEKQVILAKKLVQAETPDVKGRKLFLLMAQDFLESKRGLERIEAQNNTKGKSPVEEESPNAIHQEKESNNVLAGSDANSGSESHTRLEKLVEEEADIMIGLENLIEGLADWEDYLKKLEEKGADLKTRP